MPGGDDALVPVARRRQARTRGRFDVRRDAGGGEAAAERGGRAAVALVGYGRPAARSAKQAHDAVYDVTACTPSCAAACPAISRAATLMTSLTSRAAAYVAIHRAATLMTSLLVRLDAISRAATRVEYSFMWLLKR